MYRQFLRYNARICAGLGAWIIVIPVASTMLVLFALMAMTSLVYTHTPVLVLELLGPLVMAFVGANLLRPEYQYNTLETVLTRPVSFRAIVTVRMCFAGVGVLLLQALLALYISRVMGKDFNVLLALLAALVSMVFLTSFAVTVAAIWRSPTLGLIAAAALWGLDVAFGGRLNPLLTLGGYARAVEHVESVWAAWWVGKAALAALTLALIVVAARAGARPTGQWNVRRVVRAAVSVLLVAVIYLGAGAFHKIRWGIAHESDLGNLSRLEYQMAFRCYGPLPVAYLFGPSFARLIGYRLPWTKLMPDPEGRLADLVYHDQQQLKRVAFGPAEGQWVDNALYELGRKLMPDADGTAVSERYKLAAECFELLAGEHPESPFAALGLARLGHTYERIGRPAKARDARRRLVKIYPGTETAYTAGRAFAGELADEGRLEEAIEMLETLAPHAPDDKRPPVLVQLGDCLSHDRVGRTDDAIARYEEADRLGGEVARNLMAIENPSSEDISRRREIGAVRSYAKERLAALRGDAPAQ